MVVGGRGGGWPWWWAAVVVGGRGVEAIEADRAYMFVRAAATNMPLTLSRNTHMTQNVDSASTLSDRLAPAGEAPDATYLTVSESETLRTMEPIVSTRERKLAMVAKSSPWTSTCDRSPRDVAGCGERTVRSNPLAPSRAADIRPHSKDSTAGDSSATASATIVM